VSLQTARAWRQGVLLSRHQALRAKSSLAISVGARVPAIWSEESHRYPVRGPAILMHHAAEDGATGLDLDRQRLGPVAGNGQQSAQTFILVADNKLPAASRVESCDCER